MASLRHRRNYSQGNEPGTDTEFAAGSGELSSGLCVSARLPEGMAVGGSAGRHQRLLGHDPHGDCLCRADGFATPAIRSHYVALLQCRWRVYPFLPWRFATGHCRAGDIAICLLIASAVRPLANGDASRTAALAGTVAVLSGLLLVLGARAGIGAVADFFSKPGAGRLYDGSRRWILVASQLDKFLSALHCNGMTSFLAWLTELCGKLKTMNPPTHDFRVPVFWRCCWDLRRFAPAKSLQPSSYAWLPSLPRPAWGWNSVAWQSSDRCRADCRRSPFRRSIGGICRRCCRVYQASSALRCSKLHGRHPAGAGVRGEKRLRSQRQPGTRRARRVGCCHRIFSRLRRDGQPVAHGSQR